MLSLLWRVSHSLSASSCLFLSLRLSHLRFRCKGSIWTLSPFSYWKETGVVTGGSYGSFEGCQPYSFEPHCGSPCSVPKYSKTISPSCQRQCQSQYTKNYSDDHYKGKSAYWLRAWVLGPHVDDVRHILGNLTEELAGQVRRKILANFSVSSRQVFGLPAAISEFIAQIWTPEDLSM